MRKTVGPPPPLPKPSRPGGPSAATSGRTPSRVPTGKRKPNPVVKVQPKKPLTKSAVRNPSAPSASGPRGGGVRVITKSETFMKKDKARRDRSGIGRPQNASAFKKTDAQGKSIKRSTGNQRLIDDTQFVKRNPKGRNVSEMVTNKGNKPSKVTPKKKAEAPKKATPKRRLFVGRGGGMRGGAGGGGGFPGNMNQ